MVWISGSRLSELENIERLYLEMNDKSMKSKALRARAVLDILGVKAESVKQIQEAVGMEILADEFEMQDKYQKAAFVKTQGPDVMLEVRELLEQEGVLTRKRLPRPKK